MFSELTSGVRAREGCCSPGDSDTDVRIPTERRNPTAPQRLHVFGSVPACLMAWSGGAVV